MPGTVLYAELIDELKDNIIFSYRGTFDQVVVNTILSQVKDDLSKTGKERLLVKKTYNIMVESVENVMKHCQIQPPTIVEKEGLTVLSMEENMFCISAGNVIVKSDKGYLKNKIDAINNLSKEELRGEYTSSIKTSEISAKGGAGLGLIDIAIRSNNKLEYDFYEFDSHHYYFILKIKVSIK